MDRDYPLYSISEVARRFGISVPTIRYYEQKGLVNPTTRIARVRYYDFDALCLLAYALLWHRDAGMSIAATQEIVKAGESSERHQLILKKISELDTQIENMEDARSMLLHLLNCSSRDPLSCPHTGVMLARQVSTLMDRES